MDQNFRSLQCFWNRASIWKIKFRLRFWLCFYKLAVLRRKVPNHKELALRQWIWLLCSNRAAGIGQASIISLRIQGFHHNRQCLMAAHTITTAASHKSPHCSCKTTTHLFFLSNLCTINNTSSQSVQGNLLLNIKIACTSSHMSLQFANPNLVTNYFKLKLKCVGLITCTD